MQPVPVCSALIAAIHSNLTKAIPQIIALRNTLGYGCYFFSNEYALRKMAHWQGLDDRLQVG